jgi:hypothetical protein
MQQLTTTATITDGKFDDEALTTIVARSVLEAALAEDEKAKLWFELAGDDDETRRLEIDLSAADLEEILRMSGSDDVALTFSGDDVVGLFEDADVEAHGLRGAIAIAVTSAAILAPAGHAATTQSVGAASTTQGATVAATAQAVGAQSTAQVSTQAARTQVANAQVAGVQAKLAKSQAAAHLQAFKILRHGLVR